MHSVCKKGIRKQYRRIKAISELESKDWAVSDLEALKQLPHCEERLKILTANGRGLRTKIMLMRKIAQEKPDIIVWTEHHLAAGTTMPRWVPIMLQGYRWGCSSLANVRGQAGVVLAVHMDLLAAYKGYIYQVELRRHQSLPIMLSGVYMPTGNGAAGIIRQGIYQHLKQTLAESPLHVHIVAGDMNAALYGSD